MSALHTLMSEGAARLAAVGIDAAEAEIEIILCSLLQAERIDLYLRGEAQLTPEVRHKFSEIVARRETRYPLQYILGESWFYGRRFSVTPAVMVPTPETELLCELSLGFLRYRNLLAPRILDIGAGSGVIAVTMAAEAPNAKVTALDISPAALSVARENAASLGVAERIEFRESDAFGAVKEGEIFDLILSNPPYISEGEYVALPPEVLADPKVALTSGNEGLDMIERLIADAPPFLAPEGRLMFEIGYDQSEKVIARARRDGRYRSFVAMKDLNDIDRVIMLSLS